MEYDYLLKFTLLGETGVGKSCHLMRFIDNSFRKDHDLTIGVEFGSKIIHHEDKIIKLQIWDTAGQESFRSITRSYRRGNACALLLFDVGRRETLVALEGWINDLRMISSNAIIVIVGNKIDIDDGREISFDEAKSFADRIEAIYIEGSAKDNLFVAESYLMAAKTCYDRISSGFYGDNLEEHGIRKGNRQ